MQDPISDLQLLTSLVAAGSLSEAARRLDSSTPVMSRRLAAMESRLGVRLITRTSRRFVLTEEGALLHDRALKILAEIAEAEAETAAKMNAPQGKIRVGAPMQIGRQLVAPLIGGFNTRYPGVSVELVLSDAGLEVMEDDIDVAIRNGLPAEQNVVARKLLDSRRVVCASPKYLERHGVPQTPDDLLKHNCIRLVRGRRIFDRWAFAVDGQRHEIQVNGTLSTTSGEIVYDWALAGKGIALKAVWDIETALDEGRLVKLLSAYSCDEIALYAVFAAATHRPPRVRAFLDYLTTSLASAPKGPVK